MAGTRKIAAILVADIVGYRASPARTKSARSRGSADCAAI